MPRDTHTAWSRVTTEAVGVLGATSFVGQSLLARLHAADGQGSERRVFAFSRSARLAAATNSPDGVHWHRLSTDHGGWHESIPHWITACPLWAVPEHFPLLEASGARRVVALSSTSRFTKRDSAAASEQSLAARLAAAEDELIRLARARGILATIFRPTMIYDGIHDRNVAAIAGFIRRFGFFPVAGAAEGLRQPVHADDVAAACLAALSCTGLRDAYELSGGETLTYRAMVRRIFSWLDRPLRLPSVPLRLIQAAAPLVGRLPGVASLPAMAARMNEDLVFDHSAAMSDFGFRPRSFALPLRHDPDHAAVGS